MSLRAIFFLLEVDGFRRPAYQPSGGGRTLSIVLAAFSRV
jgi:hypothetical protein